MGHVTSHMPEDWEVVHHRDAEGGVLLYADDDLVFKGIHVATLGSSLDTEYYKGRRLDIHNIHVSSYKTDEPLLMKLVDSVVAAARRACIEAEYTQAVRDEMAYKKAQERWREQAAERAKKEADAANTILLPLARRILDGKQALSPYEAAIKATMTTKPSLFQRLFGLWR